MTLNTETSLNVNSVMMYKGDTHYESIKDH